jgi:hypothetical protein
MKNTIELSSEITNILDRELKRRGKKVFRTITDEEKLRLINDKEFTRQLLDYILFNLSMIQGTQVSLYNGDEKVINGICKDVPRIGRYPIFVYNEKLKLIKIETSKKHSIITLTCGLINAVENSIPKLESDVSTKKLVLGGKLDA